jgi:hypothetical protein
MLLVMTMKKTRTRRRHSLADVYEWKYRSIVVRFHPPRQRGLRRAAGIWDYSFGIGSTCHRLSRITRVVDELIFLREECGGEPLGGRRQGGEKCFSFHINNQVSASIVALGGR